MASIQLVISIVVVVFVVIVVFVMIGSASVVVGGPVRTPGWEGSPGCWTFW